MKKVKLLNYCNLLTGYPFKSSGFTQNEQDIPLVKGSNLSHRQIDWKSAPRWNHDDIDSYSEYHLSTGDIVLAMDRPIVQDRLKFSWITENDPKSYLVQRIARLRAKKGLTQGFLKCLIASNQFKAHIKSVTTGANVPHISSKDILNFEFSLPSIKFQENIANQIGNFDQLISTNRKKIKILEEIAQRLYEEWFVHFKFPGHEDVKMVDPPAGEASSELGKIPEGWGVNIVETIIKRESAGKRYSSKTAKDSGSVPILDQGKSGVIGFHDDSPGCLASKDNPVIVFANHTCYQNIILEPFSAIQNVIPFRPKNPNNIYWLHWATKDLIKINDYKGHWPEFMGRKVRIPTEHLQKQFGSLVKDIVVYIHTLKKKNENLKKARNLLLPRLILGEIEV